jgi:phage gp29-like protein
MADEAPKLPKNSGKERGVSGTLIFNGLITSEEYNRNLVGIAAIRQYEIMRRSDSTIRGALQVVKLPIRGANFTIRPAKGGDGEISQDAQDHADYIKHELFEGEISFNDLVRQALTMLDFGFSVFEKTFRLSRFNDKDYIGLQKIAFRKQTSIWKWTQENGDPGIVQQVIGKDNVDIPREKLVYFIHDQEGDNFQGISLLRYVYRDWDMKDKLTLVNAMALERHGMGVPITSAREGETPSVEDKSKAEEAAQNIRANNRSFIDMPSTMTIEMMDMKSQTTKEIIPTLNYHDARIMKSILAGFLELGGSSGSGSQSLSKDLTSLFMKAEEAVAQVVVNAIQQDVIKQLCDLNFTDMADGYPQIECTQIGDEDVKEMADALSALSNAKLITPTAETENYIRRTSHLPELNAEEIKQYEEDRKAAKEAANTMNTGDPGNNADNVDKPKPIKKSDAKDIEAMVSDGQKLRTRLLGALAEG